MTNATNSPDPAQSSPLPGGRMLGTGEMRWFGFTLYTASLWSATERYDPEQAFALQLTYARDFSGELLVSSSLDEIKRLGMLDASRQALWQSELARVLPDVKKGQTLTGRYLPGQGMSLYRDGQPLGEVKDVQLARAFFAIWLDPRTRDAGLRQRLIGAR